MADDGQAGENDQIATDVENLTGGGGGDSLTGNAGVNVLNGGGGNDSLDGGLGADALTGGTGTDSVSYASRVAAVTADLDGVVDDGVAGENDNLGVDIEGVIGGSANDTLTGSPSANTLDGGGGTDTLDGLGDDDALDGGTGADTLTGGAGTDTASYAARAAAVTADLDGVADDGEAGEGDNVGGDVENMTGGSAKTKTTKTITVRMARRSRPKRLH